MMEQLRVIIADDHPLFRQGIRTLLETTSTLEVVGEARTGEDTVTLARQAQPDVVLMDIQMPGMSGIEATRQIVQHRPDTRILIVSLFGDEVSVFHALRAGARGYVLKDAEPEDLLRAIQAISRGEAIFSPTIANRVMAYFASMQATAHATFPDLTDRERSILQLLAQRATNAEIARSLGLQAKTVANYVSTILNKLQVADWTQAIHGRVRQEWSEERK